MDRRKLSRPTYYFDRCRLPRLNYSWEVSWKLINGPISLNTIHKKIKVTSPNWSPGNCDVIKYDNTIEITAVASTRYRHDKSIVTDCVDSIRVWACHVLTTCTACQTTDNLLPMYEHDEHVPLCKMFYWCLCMFVCISLLVHEGDSLIEKMVTHCISTWFCICHKNDICLVNKRVTF